MATVGGIATSAFTAVAAAISDAVLTATLNDGATDYTGRVVFGGESAPGGFPVSKVDGRVRPAYIEGVSAAPAVGWTMVADSITYYVLSVRDIVQAGGLYVCNVISQADMMWKSATFENVTRTSDGAGGFADAWATLATQNCGIFAVSGTERWANQRVEAVSEWYVVTPYIPGLKEASRVTIDGVAHAITFVDDADRRGVWHVLRVTKGAA